MILSTLQLELLRQPSAFSMWTIPLIVSSPSHISLSFLSRGGVQLQLKGFSIYWVFLVPWNVGEFRLLDTVTGTTGEPRAGKLCLQNTPGIPDEQQHPNSLGWICAPRAISGWLCLAAHNGNRNGIKLKQRELWKVSLPVGGDETVWVLRSLQTVIILQFYDLYAPSIKRISWNSKWKWLSWGHNSASQEWFDRA